jgi:CxxC motif-containing protein (DUF1111 family)
VTYQIDVTGSLESFTFPGMFDLSGGDTSITRTIEIADVSQIPTDFLYNSGAGEIFASYFSHTGSMTIAFDPLGPMFQEAAAINCSGLLLDFCGGKRGLSHGL